MVHPSAPVSIWVVFGASIYPSDFNILNLKVTGMGLEKQKTWLRVLNSGFQRLDVNCFLNPYCLPKIILRVMFLPISAAGLRKEASRIFFK